MSQHVPAAVMASIDDLIRTKVAENEGQLRSAPGMIGSIVDFLLKNPMATNLGMNLITEGFALSVEKYVGTMPAEALKSVGHGLASGFHQIGSGQGSGQMTREGIEQAIPTQARAALARKLDAAERVERSSFYDLCNTPDQEWALRAFEGLLFACEEECMGDHTRARVEGGSSTLEGFAFRGRKGLLWMAENEPEKLIRAFEQAPKSYKLKARPESAFKSTWTYPMGYFRNVITLAINSNQMRTEVALDKLDASGDRNWWQKQALKWSRRLAVVGGAGIVLVLLALCALALASLALMLVGGGIISWALYPLLIEQPIVYPRLLLGIFLWAPGILILPAFTDISMILNGQSDDEESRSGFVSRLLATGLRRAGFDTSELLGPRTTVSRVRGSRKQAKRFNIIVMAVTCMAIVADIFMFPDHHSLMFRGVLLLAILFWVTVDLVAYNEKLLGAEWIRNATRNDVEWIKKAAFVLLVFIVVCGGGSTLTLFGLQTAWDRAKSSYQEHYGDKETSKPTPAKAPAKAPAPKQETDEELQRRAAEFLDE